MRPVVLEPGTSLGGIAGRTECEGAPASLQHVSTTRVDSRRLQPTPVDSSAPAKRLPDNDLQRKACAINQLWSSSKSGSIPAASTFNLL